MTQRTNARVAGFAFLFYIAVDFTQIVLSRPTQADSTAARLALIAQHAWRIRVNIVLTLVICATAVAELLLQIQGWNVTIIATFFALGSAVFSWLLLRGRLIPVPLAWLGVVASVLLVVGLPLRLVEVISGSVTQLLWLPMALFEIPLGFWLLITGVRPATARA
jgi:hypothetical protein